MSLNLPTGHKLAWSLLFSVASLGGWSYRNTSDAADSEASAQTANRAYVSQPVKLLRAEAGQLGHNADIARDVSDKALKGVWSLPLGTGSLGKGRRPWPDVKAELVSLWKADQIKSNHWQFRVHSLFVLYDLMIADEGKGQPDYIQLGKKIIDSWAANNPRGVPPCEYSWDDHASANRTIAICAFADYCDDLAMLDRKFKERLGDCLIVHAEFLAEPENYTRAHNRGIFQDYALIPDFPGNR